MASKRAAEKEIVVSVPAPSRHKPATTKRAKRTVAPVELVAAVPATRIAPSQEEIGRLAYSYWEARGFQGGSPEEDWLRAERELTTASIA